MTLAIRLAGAEDITPAFELHQQAVFRPWSYATFEDCTRPPYSLHVAAESEHLVGYAVMLMVLDEATLMDIAVKPECRGKGVGERLLDHALKHCCEQGMSVVWLEVRASNAVAQRLYQRKGFELREVRKGYYPTESGKEDAMIMAKPLVQVSDKQR